jgi:hypothetical protein
MALTTTPNGIWVLQALLGIETLPASLRLRPFVASAHDAGAVPTVAGPVPLTRTAEYAGLVAAGVIDAAGAVDGAVKDWLTVLARRDRDVTLAIRRPDPATVGTELPRAAERTLVIAQYRRWLVLIARDGQEVVLDAVGEDENPDRRVELMCATLLTALGDAEPADIEGVNLPADVLRAAVTQAGPGGPAAVAAAFGRLGLAPRLVEVLTAATRVDESALAVLFVADRGVTHRVHPRVLTLADTDSGRISISTSTATDGREWVTVWPAGRAGVHDDLVRLLTAARAA